MFKILSSNKLININIFIITFLFAFLTILEDFPTESTPKEKTEQITPVLEEKKEVKKIEEIEEIENKEIVEDVTIYSQSPQLFKNDNLNFRNNENLISFKKKYIEYNYEEENIINPIIFVGEKIKKDFNLNSGDLVHFYESDYKIIDNKSNCNNFTDNYCVEILSEKDFKSLSDIEIKKEK